MTVPVIAIIEDDLAIVQMFDLLLRDAGYRVISYTRGSDAQQFLLRTMPDLLILDWWLEDPSSGATILSFLEEDSRTRQIPVIVCSAHINTLHQEEARLRERGYRLLAKPFEIHTLLAYIQDAIGTPLPT